MYSVTFDTRYNQYFLCVFAFSETVELLNNGEWLRVWKQFFYVAYAYLDHVTLTML